MSVSLICPTCGSPATIHKPPVSVCPNCQAAWPDALRLSAEATLERAKVGRPLLLTIGMYVAPAWGGMFLLLVILAPFNAATYRIEDDLVSGWEFLQRAGLYYVAVGGSAVAAAYAIWRERSWSRWAIGFFWLAQLGGAIGFGWANSGMAGAVAGIASLLIVLLLVGWYLFDKDNVVEYYKSLEKLEASEAARRETHHGVGA
jgi:uncharacterized membrane protein YtjA (UPF0391 family)